MIDSQGRVLADLGEADMYAGASAVRLIYGPIDDGVAPRVQLWLRLGGDGGYDAILNWDETTSAFRYVFFLYRAGEFTVRFDRRDAADIETCGDIWRWDPARREYVVHEHRRDARRRCDGGL